MVSPVGSAEWPGSPDGLVPDRRTLCGDPWALGYARGKITVTVVPRSGSLSKRIDPPWSSTISLQIARPKPVPLDLVVKKGSNTFLRTSGDIPQPLSRIDSDTSRVGSRAQVTSILPSAGGMA